MATPFSIVHEFDCDAQAYWTLFWDPAFNDAQFERMQCSRTVTLLRDDGTTIVRDQEVTPERDLPFVLKSALGGASLRYHEHGVFEKPSGPMRIEISVPALGARFSLQGFYSVGALAQNRCRREFAGECAIRIPLLGGMAEQIVVGNMRESYEKGAETVRDWLEKTSP